MDKCYEHGTWYDVGELEKIMEFIKLGGVEYEKLKLTESGLSDLTRKLEDEATRLDIRINKAYRRARLYSGCSPQGEKRKGCKSLIFIDFYVEQEVFFS